MTTTPDKQPQQRQDQVTTQLLDVITKAHGDHRPLFVKESWSVGMAIDPPFRMEGIRLVVERMERGSRRPVPRPKALLTCRQWPRGDGLSGGGVPGNLLVSQSTERCNQK